ncbi:hypothetical protein QBZ16_000485 [Prototheca wickerhamii]|uniref:Ferritin-like domain-containing protein n=1 Tax=Prototheca wickerhamii TaxID=3111 RepID=A0AAD9ILE3_PROWI|nr:hypothetical protein QBZ16_000485 [Prototheca wickerhamii]
MKEKKYTDADLLNFLVNTECLEAEFNSLAAFGVGMHPKLFGKASETPTGGKKADLSWDIQLWAEEVARDEIGHVRILHEALGADGVCNVEWDPYKNDINFILSTFALEEIGATGDKGITGLVAFNGNATVVDLVGGLAQSAGYQSAADRFLLWTLRNETVPEFGKTVAEVTGAITQRRQALTGHVSVDQALVYRGGINVVPTEGNGVTIARTPQQVLSILTEGASNGKGGFFPDGVNGRITTPDPFNPPSDLNDLVRQANAPYVIVPSFKDVEDPFKLQNIPGPVDATKGSTAGVTEGTGSWFTSILPGVHDKEL